VIVGMARPGYDYRYAPHHGRGDIGSAPVSFSKLLAEIPGTGMPG
jgi:hypothetical protein